MTSQVDRSVVFTIFTRWNYLQNYSIQPLMNFRDYRALAVKQLFAMPCIY